MTTTRDYYEILGIDRNATKQDVKKAYRKLAMQYHPDRNKEPGAEDKFKEISEAYAVLSDETKKQQYDHYGHAGIDGRYSEEDIFRGTNFDDIFREFGFGGFGSSIFENVFGGGGQGRRQRAGPERGDDLRVDLELSLEDVANGIKTSITVPHTKTCPKCRGSKAMPGTKPKTCPSCSGTGQKRDVRSRGFSQFISITTCTACGGQGRVVEKPCNECSGHGVVEVKSKVHVRIPAGIDTGSRIRISAEGDAGAMGGPPGDLYVVVHVKPHPVFERHADDIICQMPITFAQAAVGTEIEVPKLAGKKATIKIPAGTQTGTVFRLKGMGIPHLRGGAGDELVRVVVKTPEKLGKKERQLLHEFAHLRGEKVTPEKGIMDMVKGALGS